METLAIYSNKPVVEIRESCFYPAAEGWTAPEPDELQTMLARLKWSAANLETVLGVTDRTVRRWLSGTSAMPFAAWCIMSYQAGYGEIWKTAGKAAVDMEWLYGMSTRLKNCLIREGYESLDQLMADWQTKPVNDWVSMSNFGQRCYKELASWIASKEGA